MRKILLAMMAATLSISFAVMPHPVVSHAAGSSPGAGTIRIDAGGFSHARVTYPGSRGCVVAI